MVAALPNNDARQDTSTTNASVGTTAAINFAIMMVDQNDTSHLAKKARTDAHSSAAAKGKKPSLTIQIKAAFQENLGKARAAAMAHTVTL